MPRSKSGKVARNRRKKILKLAKGYFGSKHRLFRTANEQVMKALKNAYHDRKEEKEIFVNYGLQELMPQLNYMEQNTQF